MHRFHNDAVLSVWDFVGRDLVPDGQVTIPIELRVAVVVGHGGRRNRTNES